MKKLYLTSLEIKFPNLENKVPFQAMVVVSDEDVTRFIKNAYDYSEKLHDKIQSECSSQEIHNHIAQIKSVVHYKEKFRDCGCQIISCVVEELIDNQPLFQEHTTLYFNLLEGKINLNDFYASINGNYESLPPKGNRAPSLESLLHHFYNRISGTSQLEATEREFQEKEWKEWIKTIDVSLLSS